MKIHILGGPGSGKTTFARQLASTVGAPHHDLDQVGWRHGDQIAAYIDEAEAIAAQPAWITEGIYLTWTDPLLHAADRIVVLDVPWPTAAWRIVQRHVRRSLHGTNPYPGVNGAKLLFKLLQFTRGYYVSTVRSDPAVAQAVQALAAEQAADDRSPDAACLLARWETYRDAIPLTADFVRIYVQAHGEKVMFAKTNADRTRLVRQLTHHQTA